MQLKKIKGQMAVATCALLQAASPAANAAEAEWDVDTSLLYYSEADGRVQAAEPAIHAGRDLGDDERIDFRVVFDALTGATPNGGYATSAAQTFTTPSGDSTYVTAAGDSPLMIPSGMRVFLWAQTGPCRWIACQRSYGVRVCRVKSIIFPWG